jgi:paspaline synthase
MALGTPYTIPPPPPAYEPYIPLLNVCNLISGLCWVACYLGQARHSMTHQTYIMPFFAQASNLAWEFVYGGLIYPSPLAIERLVFLSGFATNTILQYTAIRYGRAEWAHAPLVARNLGTLYTVTIAVFVLGNLAAAQQFGPHIANYYIAILAQLIISVGSLAQLLNRGATRGFSLWLW